MEIKKNELCEENLEQVSGGVNPEEHNVMLGSLRPDGFVPNVEPADFEKAHDGKNL